MIGIYKITSPSGKVYVGQSVRIEKRFRDYVTLRSCSEQPRLYRSFLKYGVEFHIFEILEECLVHELNERERYFQDLYNVIGVEGLNCKLQGTADKSGYLSEEIKTKITLTKTGKRHSEEAKAKMSAAKLGIKRSEEFNTKIRGVRGPQKNPRKKRRPHSEETKAKMRVAKKIRDERDRLLREKNN